MTRAKRWTPRLGVPDRHGQVQRQVRDVRERVRRVDRERREHRVHVLLERALQLHAVGAVEVVPVEEPDARLLEAGPDVLRERGRLALDQGADLLADDANRLERVEAVGRAGTQAGRELLLEPGDAHLEELVEVRGEDGQELGALEQRPGRVLGEREHAGVEVEPRQLAVR